MHSSTTIKTFLRTYGDMNKFDLITELMNKYNNEGYFGQRKSWIKRTFGELLVVLYEIEIELEKEEKDGLEFDN